MDDEQHWWFCLKHMTVEPMPAARARTGSGPYPSREAAANALETCQARNEEWDAQDRWPGEPADGCRWRPASVRVGVW
jgi:hypothetical protein